MKDLDRIVSRLKDFYEAETPTQKSPNGVDLQRPWIGSLNWHTHRNQNADLDVSVRKRRFLSLICAQ
jgi:hypothetical protein